MHRPYPFDALPKLTRGQVHALARWHALFADAACEEGLRVAERLLGTTLACTVGLPYAAPAERATPAVWVELDALAAPDLPSAWLELPPELAELAADRVLGGDSELLPVAGGTLDAIASGALAYLLARVLAALSVPLALRGVSSAAPQLAETVCVPLSLSCGGQHGALRLYVPARWLARAHAERPALRSVPELRVWLWADGGYARLDLATLRSLEHDDRLVLEHSGLVRAEGGVLEGTVQVRVEGSASALRCRVREDALEVEAIACTSERSMTQGRHLPETEANATLARDTPIELSLELARFQLSLGELERMRAGDVLLAGRRIGELVTLRAAGQAFAEGELVDVEGELAVRITRFL